MKRPERNNQGGQVPPGFVLVEAILTSHQVYIVQQWAKLAQAEIEAARVAAEVVPARNVRQEKRRADSGGLHTFD